MGVLSILNILNIFNDNKLYKSFRITFIILLFTLLITIINIFFIKEKKAKFILLSEILVLIIALFFYGMFIKVIKKYKNDNEMIPYNIINDIIRYRYIDWLLTTPLLLLSLILFLNYLSNDIFEYKKYLIVIFLNFIMLLSGYLGEINYINKYISLTFGFIFYLILILYIWYNYVKNVSYTKYVFFIFSIIWGLYGVAFLFDNTKQNIFYNSLDTISKGFFGIFINIFYSSYIY